MPEKYPLPGGLHLLFILAPGGFGGVESVVAALVPGLIRRGVTVSCALVGEDVARTPLAVACLEAGAEVVPVAVGARAYAAEYTAIRALIRERAPVLVHTHGYRSDLVAGLAARRVGVPWISTAHGFTSRTAQVRCYERMQRRAWRRCDQVIAVSRPMANRLVRSGVAQRRVELIPNGFGPIGVAPRPSRAEARARLGVSADATVVGWVGRLSVEKGPDVMLEAAAQLSQPGLRVVFIGDGPERARLEAAAAARGLTERIVFAGAIPDARDYFAAFDLFALTSRTEGTPMVLFEAMAGGVPIVATAVGGVPDVLTDGTALLVASEAPAAFAAAVTATLADPAGVATRTAAAKARLTTVYGFDVWLDRHIELYTVLAARSGRFAS